jgi:hypothetical protein
LLRASISNSKEIEMVPGTKKKNCPLVAHENISHNKNKEINKIKSVEEDLPNRP